MQPHGILHHSLHYLLPVRCHCGNQHFLPRLHLFPLTRADSRSFEHLTHQQEDESLEHRSISRVETATSEQITPKTRIDPQSSSFEVDFED